MTIIKTLILAAALLAIALARAAHDETESVHIGKREIRLPAPEGYFRFTGYRELLQRNA